jgi:pilus assembly protein CpaE
MRAGVAEAAAGIDSLRVLIVSESAALVAETQDALAGMRERRTVMYAAASAAEAIEIGRDRQPHVAMVDLDLGRSAVAFLARELHALVPGLLVAGAYESAAGAGTDAHAALIIELLRVGVRDFLRRPLSAPEVAEAVERWLADRAPSSSSSVGHVAAFISNKGGVGKSTLAVNVACALATRHPGRVLLVDAALQLGVCAFMLDLDPVTTIVDAAKERERLDETLLRSLTLPHESGLRLLAAPADALEAADVGDEAVARVIALARRSFDFVVVDTFPMLDSVVMATLDASDTIFVVVQAAGPTVAGAARLLPVLDGLGFPPARQQIVLSRNHARFLGDLTVGDVAGQLGRAVDYAVPYDRGVLAAMNAGRPRVLHAPRWRGFPRAVQAMADRMAERRLQVRTERRSGRDRRVRNIGRPEGERRSGLDRRDVARDARAARGGER